MALVREYSTAVVREYIIATVPGNISGDNARGQVEQHVPQDISTQGARGRDAHTSKGKLLASLSSLTRGAKECLLAPSSFWGHIDPKVCTKKQLSPHSRCCLLHCRCARGDL